MSSKTPSVCRTPSVLFPLRSSQIFGIETNKVNTDIHRLLLYESAHFEHNSHTAGSIIRTKNRGAMVRLVRVVVCPGTAIPVSTKQNPVGIGRVDACNDVACRQFRTVPNGHIERLFFHFGTIRLE